MIAVQDRHILAADQQVTGLADPPVCGDVFCLQTDLRVVNLVCQSDLQKAAPIGESPSRILHQDRFIIGYTPHILNVFLCAAVKEHQEFRRLLSFVHIKSDVIRNRRCDNDPFGINDIDFNAGVSIILVKLF